MNNYNNTTTLNESISLVLDSRKTYKWVDVNLFTNHGESIVTTTDELIKEAYNHPEINFYASCFSRENPKFKHGDPLYGDFRLIFKGDLELALLEAKKTLLEAIKWVPNHEGIVDIFYEHNGFEIVFKAQHFGAEPNPNLPGTYRKMAELIATQLDLKTLDFGVYNSDQKFLLPIRVWKESKLINKRDYLSTFQLFAYDTHILEWSFANPELFQYVPGTEKLVSDRYQLDWLNQIYQDASNDNTYPSRDTHEQPTDVLELDGIHAEAV